MSDNIKYALIKLGMAIATPFGIGLFILAGYVFFAQIMTIWGAIVCLAGGVIFLGLAEFLRTKRNKDHKRLWRS